MDVDVHCIIFSERILHHVYPTMQMDGPGLNYIRASYRKQAAQVAEGKSRMLRSRPPAEAQAGPLPPCSTAVMTSGSTIVSVNAVSVLHSLLAGPF